MAITGTTIARLNDSASARRYARRMRTLSAMIVAMGMLTMACRGTVRCREDERFDEEGRCVAVSTCPAGRDPATGVCQGMDAAIGDASLDAGTGDAGLTDGCVAGSEVCNGANDDCDEAVDETVICSLPNVSSSSCQDGTCEVDGCADGWLDCTSDPGCETADRARSTCGACGSSCAADEGCTGTPPACAAHSVGLVKHFAGLENSYAAVTAVAVDDSGRTYAALQSGPYEIDTVTRASASPSVSAFDLDGSHLWSLWAGNPTEAYVSAIGSAAGTGVVVGGSVKGDFMVGTHGPVSAATGWDSYVAYARGDTGNVEWLAHITGTGDQQVEDIDDTVVVGRYAGSLEIDGSPIATSGNGLWIATFDVIGPTMGTLRAFTVPGWSGPDRSLRVTKLPGSAERRVVVTASLEGTWALGGAEYTGDFTPIVFLVDTATENIEWVVQLPPAGEETPTSTTVGADGNLYLVSDCRSECTLPGGRSLEAGGGYFLSLTPAGSPDWSATLGPGVVPTGVAGTSTSIVATGHFSQTTDFGTGDLSPRGVNDAFLLDVGLDGEVQWARALDASLSDEGLDVVVDDFDRIYLGARFAGLVMLNGTSYPASSNLGDGLLVRFDPP